MKILVGLLYDCVGFCGRGVLSLEHCNKIVFQIFRTIHLRGICLFRSVDVGMKWLWCRL